MLWSLGPHRSCRTRAVPCSFPVASQWRLLGREQPVSTGQEKQDIFFSLVSLLKGLYLKRLSGMKHFEALWPVFPILLLLRKMRLSCDAKHLSSWKFIFSFAAPFLCHWQRILLKSLCTGFGMLRFFIKVKSLCFSSHAYFCISWFFSSKTSALPLLWWLLSCFKGLIKVIPASFLVWAWFFCVF